MALEPQTVCDDVLETSKCRHVIIRQTCGRDDSLEMREAVKQRRPFLPLLSEWQLNKQWNKAFSHRLI